MGNNLRRVAADDVVMVPAGELGNYSIVDGGTDGLYLLWTTSSVGGGVAASVALTLQGLTVADIPNVTIQEEPIAVP